VQEAGQLLPRGLIRLAAVLGAALACAGQTPAAAGIRGLEFRVPELSGGSVSHEDFRGKILIVDVWATWCGPCRMVIPHLIDLQARFASDGVAVVGLNADETSGGTIDTDPIKRFVHEFEINYPIGLMNAPAYLEVSRVMGFDPGEGMALPTTIVMGRNGRVIKRYPGYFPGQEREIAGLISRLLEEEKKADKRAPSRTGP